MSLADDLRSQLSVAMGRCPTCGRGGGLSVRQAAATLGVSPATLQRFLSGRQVASDFLDKVAAWLETKA